MRGGGSAFAELVAASDTEAISTGVTLAFVADLSWAYAKPAAAHKIRKAKVFIRIAVLRIDRSYFFAGQRSIR